MNNSSWLENDVVQTTSLAYTYLEVYANFYWRVHPYLGLAICIFGITTNIVNIVILCKPSMKNSINGILTGIAITDIVNMMDYIPYIMHFYLLTDLEIESTLKRYTFPWAIYLAVHSCISNVTHAVSIWLAAFMSVFRYVFICSRGKCNLTVTNTRLVILGIYISSIVILIPNNLVTKVHPEFDTHFNVTIYRLTSLNVYLGNSSTISTVNVWLYILAVKMIPCTIICVCGILLLRTLQHNQQVLESLKRTPSSQRTRAHKRTTLMLLAIMLMFVISELPNTVLLISSVFVTDFFQTYYLLFADTLDVLSLINNAINFIMYCTMSRQFRDCLYEHVMFCKDDRRGSYQLSNSSQIRVSRTPL